MQQLQRAIAVYEQWLADGREPSPEQLLAQHEDLRDLLAAMLADRAEIAAAVVAADDEGRVLGDFRLLAEIGRGGMGVVYRARQRSLDREVALKVLPHHVTLQPSAIARFRREATLAARLEHPSIVAIHAVGSDGDAHWFAMELVDGAPLDRVDPRTGKPRTVRECVELGASICDALAHAHAAGVLHRDVKPSNILLRADGRPVLTDFGLARELGDPGITRAGAFAGTPHYAAPEQVAGREVDARADVFGLGATLYELLTGRRPFDGGSTPEVLDRIVHAEPPDPVRLVPDLAPDLAAIVLKALEKDPARRYQTARAFGDDLRAFLEFRPVAARRATALARVQRWLHHHPAWRATLVVAFAALLLVPVVISFAVAAERDRAVLAEQRARRDAYSSKVVAATAAQAAGDSMQVEELLAACPEDLRGFEWRFLERGLDNALWTAAAHRAPVTSLCLARDATRLASGSSEGEIVVHDLIRGAELWRKAGDPDDAVELLEFTADAGHLLVASSKGRLRRFDAATGRVVATGEPVAAGPHGIAIAADATAVVGRASAGRYVVLDPRTLAAVAQHLLPVDEARPEQRFVTDGRRLAGTCLPGCFATWDLHDGVHRRSAVEDPPSDCLAAAEGLGRIASFHGQHGFAWWDPGHGDVRWMHHGARRVLCTALTPDGRQLVAGCARGELLVIDLDRARVERTLHGHRNGIQAVDAARAGWIATGDRDGVVKLWNTFLDAGSGELAGVGMATSLAGRGFGRALAIGGDGALYTGSLDGTVTRFDVAPGTVSWQVQLPHWVNGLAVVRGGAAIAATWHSSVRLLDVQRGTPVGADLPVLPLGHAAQIVADAAGNRLAYLDQTGRLLVLDVASGRATGPVTACTVQSATLDGAICWDERTGSLLVAGADGVVKRLAAATLAVQAQFPVGHVVTDLALDGDHLLVAGCNPARTAGVLSRWSRDGAVLATRTLSSPVAAIAATADRVAIARWDGRLGLHQRSDFEPVLELQQPARALWHVVAPADGRWLAIQCIDGEPRVLLTTRPDASLAQARARAQRQIAGQLAADALQPTGWVPHARDALAARTDLDAELRAAAIAALPPVTGWRIAADSMLLATAPDAARVIPERLADLQAALTQGIAADVDSHTDALRVALALVELRRGSPAAALQALSQPVFVDGGGEWCDAIVHFVLASAHAALGDRAAAEASLARLRASLATNPHEWGPDLLREAEARLAAAGR